MAGDWIKFEKGTLDKPEVFAISAITGLDPDAVVGKLLRVWAWFDTHTQSGNAFLVTSALLDRIAGATGFSDAMQSVGWLVIDKSGVELPGFDRHNGQTAKARAETARRVAQHRAEKKTIARPLRRSVLERDGGKCVYCGRAHMQYTPPESAKDAVMSMDHVIPESRGGTDSDRNLVCACVGCNMAKADRTPEEAGMKWPADSNGVRYGEVVTGPIHEPLAREEKRREEFKEPETPSAPAAPAPGAGEVPKRIRASKSDAPKTTHRFAEFWAAYPIKKGRADALKKWAQKGLDAIADQIIAHVRRMEAEDAQWKRGFIPHGSTYVNAEGWQDEPARDPDEIAAGAAADPSRRPAGWFRSSSSESELQRDIGWVMHRWERGDFGAGAAGIAERDRLVSEVRAAHQFTGA
jgi:5-methylcytosine-specific restriction endonuclease McrA